MCVCVRACVSVFVCVSSVSVCRHGCSTSASDNLPLLSIVELTLTEECAGIEESNLQLKGVPPANNVRSKRGTANDEGEAEVLRERNGRAQAFTSHSDRDNSRLILMSDVQFVLAGQPRYGNLKLILHNLVNRRPHSSLSKCLTLSQEHICDMVKRSANRSIVFGAPFKLKKRKKKHRQKKLRNPVLCRKEKNLPKP